MKRAVILLLDSFGIGAAPDAELFGDSGADTFGHIYEYYQKKGKFLNLPNLYSLGLLQAAGFSRGKQFSGAPAYEIKAAYGYASPVSKGKDTLSGHWELTGVPVDFDWGYFPEVQPCFPAALIQSLVANCALPGVLGEKHASGVEIIKELGEEHILTGKPIVYTSADSVFQIAAHEKYFGLARLYEICAEAFQLVQPYHIARVIARPFVGESAADFVRTANRKDYAVAPPEPTLLDYAKAAGQQVVGIGKIKDIFAGQGLTAFEKGADLQELMDNTLSSLAKLKESGIIFTNFVDFDSKFGHRRDIQGYGQGLEYLDSRLPGVFRLLREDDLCLITADHGCDPAFRGSDHTRENIPVLFSGAKLAARYFGQRKSFSDVGQTLASHLELPPLKNGRNCF